MAELERRWQALPRRWMKLYAELPPMDVFGVATALEAVKEARRTLDPVALWDVRRCEKWLKAWQSASDPSRAQLKGALAMRSKALRWRALVREEDARLAASDPRWSSLSLNARARTLRVWLANHHHTAFTPNAKTIARSI